MIIAEMLAGQYDNANQAYFDKRLKKDDEVGRTRKHVAVEPVAEASLGEQVFKIEVNYPGSKNVSKRYWLTFGVDYKRDLVRMKTYRRKQASPSASFEYVKNCDMLWDEQAAQFHGEIESKSCRHKDLPKDIFLSEDAIWISWEKSKRNHDVLERARNFSCYIDVPGVGGGRDIPYKRYQIDNLHDKGGKSWVALVDGSEVSVTLQNIRWPMNNQRGVFTRHSLVMYVGKKLGAKEEEVSYTWTSPEAQRIGLNLKWMLVNCYMISNEEVKPYFKREPRV